MAVADLRLHPQAGRAPPMPEQAFAEFVADVKERGVLDAVELLPGTDVILDGRSRWLAAQEAGRDTVPVTDAALDGLDPVVFMIRRARLRRHLSVGQQA